MGQPELQDGKPVRIVGILADITDRKQMEEEHGRLATMLEHSLNEIYVFDPVTLRFSFVNQGALRNLGYSLAEMKEKTPVDIKPLFTEESFRARIRPLVDREKPLLFFETVHRRKDQTEYPVDVHLQLVGDGDQRMFLAIINDTTERAKLQQELARMASFPVQTPYPVVEIAVDGSLRFANPAAIDTLARLGMEPDARLFLSMAPDELSRLRARCVRAPVTDELRLGTGTFFRAITTPPGEDALRIYLVDVTERKRAEEEKETLQRRLLQSQKMEAIGQLAGGVAHDFNNLLTGILGNIALIRDGLPQTDPLRNNLNAAETAARRASDLTRGLLTFSRNEMVIPVPLNAGQAVGEVADLLRQSLPATIAIVRDVQPDAWNILADRSEVTQILLNLVVNARDAMRGKGTITLGVHNEVIDSSYVREHPDAQPGEHVHLSVTDEGPGMPDEIMEHLFEPFHTTKPLGSGTGLGLSIVYGAVKQAGGWVTVSSASGLGTTFDIYLPRCLSPAVSDLSSTAEAGDACRGTILVAEDEPVVAAVAESFLKRSGCTVILASDGVQALEMFSAHHQDISLVLLDMTMPGLSTDEIIAGLRAHASAVPILLTSGYTSGDEVTGLLDSGSVQGFLPKPYDLSELLKAVRSVLTKRQQDHIG
jgi:PAS domain S-box-containing protein